ncbi:hypothetical protein VTH06DRAFT_638 [Thermothelomyces fergusii]
MDASDPQLRDGSFAAAAAAAAVAASPHSRAARVGSYYKQQRHPPSGAASSFASPSPSAAFASTPTNAGRRGAPPASADSSTSRRRRWWGWRGWWGRGRGRRQRGLEELTSGTWRPARARLDGRWPAAHGGGELESEWYERAYGDLFGRVRDFAAAYFGYGDLADPSAPSSSTTRGVRVWVPPGGAPGRGGSVWADAGLSEQFCWFVAQVAVQDNNAGGWDVLLTRRRQREHLVAGVIGKILEMEVFDDLLFGADRVQKRMLEAQDECTLDYEGYYRTGLRAQCVRALLGSGALTPEFWPSVDRLALQITVLLLPLVDLMDEHFAASQATSLRSVYQDLHAIVAQAGYLSLGIRWSKTIFHFSSPVPGTVWDNDQTNADDRLYRASEAANTRADAAAEKQWKSQRARQLAARAERREAQDRGAGALAALRGFVTGRGPEEGSGGGRDANDVWHRPSRMGKVQIVVWPMLQRFATVGEIDPRTGTASGESITTISKSRVVYYHGRVDPTGEVGDASPSLAEWVRTTGRRRARSSVLLLRWAACLAGICLLLVFLAGDDLTAADGLLRHVRHVPGEVARYVIREAALFVMEVLITVIAFFIAFSRVFMYLTYPARNSLANLLEHGHRWLLSRVSGVNWREVFETITARHRSASGHHELSWALVKDVAKALAEQLMQEPATVSVPVESLTYAAAAGETPPPDTSSLLNWLRR